MAPHRSDSVFNTDPPVHTKYRRMMTAPFTFKMIWVSAVDTSTFPPLLPCTHERKKRACSHP